MSLLHQIALTSIPGVGSVTGRALLAAFGSAEDVFKAKRSKLMAVQGIGGRTADALIHKRCFERAEEEIKFIEQYRIQPLFFQDEAYPSRLNNCCDAPLMLYYKGNAHLNQRRVISIVGTRNATAYGKELSDQLVKDLQKHDVLVISGLAYGIDILAHKACLKHKVPTIGVLGHGLDRIYPGQHRQVAEKMLETGGLLTEFFSQTNPDRENFPKRNRIIAGMCDATIVIEAGLKGGALITADIANSYNRDVFAFPGSVFEEFSAGCNRLIRTNRAHLLTGIKDLEFMMGWNKQEKPVKPQQVSLMLNFTEEERAVADLLSSENSAGIDELSIRTGIAHSKLIAAILSLEMQGIIHSLPGNIYKMA